MHRAVSIALLPISLGCFLGKNCTWKSSSSIECSYPGWLQWFWRFGCWWILSLHDLERLIGRRGRWKTNFTEDGSWEVLSLLRTFLLLFMILMTDMTNTPQASGTRVRFSLLLKKRSTGKPDPILSEIDHDWICLCKDSVKPESACRCWLFLTWSNH